MKEIRELLMGLEKEKIDNLIIYLQLMGYKLTYQGILQTASKPEKYIYQYVYECKDFKYIIMIDFQIQYNNLHYIEFEFYTDFNIKLNFTLDNIYQLEKKLIEIL